MRPRGAKSEFEKVIGRSGRSLPVLMPDTALELMAGFYREQRVVNAALDEDQDMLLCQWGVYDLEGEEVFRFDVIRHFIENGTEDEDGMSQLVLGCIYAPAAELHVLQSGEIWCHTPEHITAFEGEVTASAAFRAVNHVKPMNVTLDYNVI